MERNRLGRSVWWHYLLVAILLCAAIAAFFSFARENSVRIARQNQQYAHDAALQTASRVEDMLEARATTLDLMSITAAETIKEPWISTDLLRLLQDTSVFDYVEFIDETGLNHNADGLTSDSTDRKNYLRGIQGETGFHVVFNTRITHETIVIFYTPVYYRGRIIGVLNGMFREETLRKAISVTMFDAEVKSLICMADGTVISSYGYDSAAENLADGLTQGDGVSGQSLSELQSAFAARDTFYCTAQGAAGDVSISLIPIGEDWMLAQTFPSSVTRSMKTNANSAGFRLLLHLIILFLVYVVYLFVTNLHKRRQLTSEKVRLNGIVEGLVPLFARLVIMDPEQEGYEYLKGAPSDLPAHGTVTALKNYMASRYLSRGGDNPSPALPSLDEARTMLSDGAAFLQYEYRIRWEGEERFENVSILGLRQRDGIPVSLIFAVQDVTALQRQKDTMQQTLRDALHTADDLSRAKSDFLSRMSHNMRTPMNAVLGMASIALSHLDDADQVRDCLESIDAYGRQLLGLINEVLDMSKIESGGMVLEKTRLGLANEIDTVLDEARSAAAKKKLRLNTDIRPFDHGSVFGDPERFRQILRHLLDNAVKYTPAGGTVTLRARELPSLALKSGYYEFVVEDTGPGIEPGLLPKIFEPFVSGEFCRDDLSTGLGLSIAQAIAKLMSGEIQVESEPGRGSKFTLHVFFKLEETASALPGPAAAPEQESDPKSVMRHAGLRVLLADDIEINRLIIQKQLHQAGLLVETAENGAEALDCVRNNQPGYYDLVFMDLQMPIMDGCEATRAIRALGREDLLSIPIVAVTANGFQENVSQAKDAGMNDLLTKPVGLDMLLAALDQWLPKKAAAP